MFSDRADTLPSTLMATPIDRSWLFVRGRTPEQVERFRLEDHPLYGELPEAQRGHAEAEILAQGSRSARRPVDVPQRPCAPGPRQSKGARIR